MRRTAIAALLAAILTVATAASAIAAAPPKQLTNQYPLGTQTLCCQSHSATTPKSGATPKQSATTPKAPTQPAQTTPQPQQSQPAQHSPAAHQRTSSHGTRNLILIALVAGVILMVGLDLLFVRRRRRTSPRRRRTVAKPLLALLSPLFGYDYNHDAWILRGIGKQYGPVLRPKGHVSIREIAPTYTPEVRATRTSDADPTPDPFATAGPSRPRSRKDDRVPAAPPDREPRPLRIRPRDE